MNLKTQLYLDFHASAPVADFCLNEMERARPECWANPSSVHAAGRRAKHWLELCREHVATSLGAKPADIVFTSGGTEACNLGIQSLLSGVTKILTTDIEHPAIAAKLDQISQEQGIAVQRIRTANGEAFDLNFWESQITHASSGSSHKTLVAMQWVNHETGIRFPVERISELCQKKNARLFLDATQALGKIPIDVSGLAVDALATASHKIGGPSGAGALWIGRKHSVHPLMHGGAQERGRRAGSPGLESIIGFGAACSQIHLRIEQTQALGEVRDRLQRGIQNLGGVINGIKFDRAPTVVNASFKGARGAVLVAAMDMEGICVSSGSACSSGLDAPSRIIENLYPNEPWRAGSCLRFSFGPGLPTGWVDRTLRTLEKILARINFK